MDVNDQVPSPSGLYAPLTADVVHLLARLSERCRLETATTEHEPDDKRHRVAAEGLKRLGEADKAERHILNQLAWLHATLHQRDLDQLKLDDKVSVTLRSNYRPSLGCSQWTFHGTVRWIERDPFSEHVTKLRVRYDGQRFELKGAELKDVRPIPKAADNPRG
jgi:hypothetical protein